MRTPALALLLATIAPLGAQTAKPDEAALNRELAAKGFVITKQGNATNIDAPGNLGPNQPFTGSTLAEIGPEHNPIDLLRRAIEIFHAQPKIAYQLVLAATLRASYDMQRVADPTAHQGWKHVSTLRPVAQIIFWGAYSNKVGRADSEEVLAWARKSGPPTYHPSWMIQHGMAVMRAAMERKDPPAPLVADFDAANAWEQTAGRMAALVASDAYWERRQAQATPLEIHGRLVAAASTMSQELMDRKDAPARKAGLAILELANGFDEKCADPAMRFVELNDQINALYEAAMKPAGK
jgi:hypothetical protein